MLSEGSIRVFVNCIECREFFNVICYGEQIFNIFEFFVLIIYIKIIYNYVFVVIGKFGDQVYNGIVEKLYFIKSNYISIFGLGKNYFYGFWS